MLSLLSPVLWLGPASWYDRLHWSVRVLLGLLRKIVLTALSILTVWSLFFFFAPDVISYGDLKKLAENTNAELDNLGPQLSEKGYDVDPSLLRYGVEYLDRDTYGEYSFFIMLYLSVFEVIYELFS